MPEPLHTPIAPIFTSPPTALAWAPGPHTALLPVPPDPGPETPVVVVAQAPRVQLHAFTGAGGRLGEIRSASIDSWNDPLTGASGVSAVASGHDPLLWSLGTPVGRVYGVERRILDAKALDFLVTVDGALEREGVLPHDVELGGDTVRLDLRGGMELLRGTTLRGGDNPDGVGLQPSIEDLELAEDRLLGAGSFDGSNPTQGWTSNGGVTFAATEAQALSPPRSLRVSGAGGAVFGPWRNIPGSPHLRDGYRIELSALVPAVPDGGSMRCGVAVQIQRRMGGAWVDRDPGGTDSHLWWSEDADPAERQWQSLQAAGAVARSTDLHRMRMIFVVWENTTGQPIHIDEVRYRQNSRIGAALPEDLSHIARRVLLGSVFRRPGHRMAVDVASVTGSEVSMLWHTSDRVLAADALDAVCSRPDGPDVWVRPNWRWTIAARRGSDRNDVRLDPQSMINCTWTVGPGVDDHTTLARPTIQHRTPYAPGRLRTERTVRPPDGRWGTQQQWAAGWARQAALTQVSGVATVPWDLGRSINTGDTLMVAVVVGDSGAGWAGRARIFDRVMNPRLHTVDLHWGVDPVATGVG